MTAVGVGVGECGSNFQAILRGSRENDLRTSRDCGLLYAGPNQNGRESQRLAAGLIVSWWKPSSCRGGR